MKKIIGIIALMLLSLSSFAQFDPETQLGIEYNNLNQKVKQQQNEIGKTIRSEVEAQIRQQQKQAAKQQAIENYNNKISAEGQSRMEYYNNPNNYIDRSITNRGSSYTTNELRSSSPQARDLRTEPIHSENLNSKSLQMLHEANRDYFSNGEGGITIDPNARVQLFDAPSLGEYKPLEKKPSRVQQILKEQARKKAERKALENEVAVRNDLIDLTKDVVDLMGGVMFDDAVIALEDVNLFGLELELGKGTAGFLLSENLSLFSEMAKYWNECSAGTKTTKRDFNRIERKLGIDDWESFYGAEMVDSYEIIKNATVNSAIGKIATVIGDKAGVAYVNFEKMGTGAMEVFTSMKISFSLSNFAVSNEKHEE